MKKGINLAVILSLMLFFTACNKDIESPKEANTQTSAPILIKDGIIQFSTNSSFVETCDKLRDMNEMEFQKWEDSLNFKSLRSEINLALNEMDACNDSLTFYTLLNANKDILQTKDSTIYLLLNRIPMQV